MRESAVDIGFVMWESGESVTGSAEVHFTDDWRQVLCMDADADIEWLEAMERDLRVELSQTEDRAGLLKRIQESCSQMVQLSSTKMLAARDMAQAARMLSETLLEPRGRSGQPRLVKSARQRIWETARRAFEDAGVWEQMMKEIAVAPYTGAGDPLKIDFGYRVAKEVKMFHAVSLRKNVEQAISLAYRFPKLADGVLRERNEVARLTALVDEYDAGGAQVGFALGQFAEFGVGVETVGKMGEVAERARVELGRA
jgi:hypothetical protein